MAYYHRKSTTKHLINVDWNNWGVEYHRRTQMHIQIKMREIVWDLRWTPSTTLKDFFFHVGSQTFQFTYQFTF